MSETEAATIPRDSSLDISSARLEEFADLATRLVTDYFTQITEVPIFPQGSVQALVSNLGCEVPLEGEPIEQLFADCLKILAGNRHNGHPRFFGYIASPATPAGAFADLIASTLNANVTAWRSAPAATEIERLVTRWLGSVIGYSDQAQGLLTSGGSMANLTALLIAHRTKSRDQSGHKGLWNSGPPMTIYASEEIHLSIPKAADILGIGRDQIRGVPCDNEFRLNPQELRKAIQTDLRSGLRPFCVVANAGTVSTGAVDPLAEIAAIAREFQLWFHIDGAYGAPGTLDQSKRHLFAGLDLADSVSLDAHKWLYVPIDAGCLLFHDAAAAQRAFSSSAADYIKVHSDREGEEFAFWDYGIELSRRFRALKIWMTLRYYGVRLIADAIAGDNKLAAYLGERIEAAKYFELLAPVTLSICCFRYVPETFSAKLVNASEQERIETEAQLDLLNTEIMRGVQRGGEAYISNATIHGKFALRMCITNFRTTQADIDKTLQIIRAAAQQIIEANS